MNARSIFILMVIVQNALVQGFSQGFGQIRPIVTAAIVKNTGEKPQSKVWFYDGKWWAVITKSDGTFVARLDGTHWSYQLKISSSTSAEADCKVAGNICHILLWKRPPGPSQLISVEYNAESKSYSHWSLRSQTASIPLDSGSETGTIDIDDTGRMWLATDGVDDIRVWWSDAPYALWNGPLIIASGVTDDDICAVISLPAQKKIGILWSNQNTKRFGFKTHDSSGAPSDWSADEVPASSSALDVGNGMADDHLNFAAASDGTLYCAVKTSYDIAGYPRLALLKRRPAGQWEQLYEVSQSGTRGIVILNELTQKIKVIYTSREDGGLILYRESSTASISFGEAFTLIDGVHNNPTSSKENYEDEILILASDEQNLVGVVASDELSVPVRIASDRYDENPFVRYFPNPVKDILTIQLKEAANEEMFVVIADALGRAFLQTWSRPSGDRIEIDVSALRLKPGVHFLILRPQRGDSQMIRFVKH